jgi:hypothetical protein
MDLLESVGENLMLEEFPAEKQTEDNGTFNRQEKKNISAECLLSRSWITYGPDLNIHLENHWNI